MGLLSRAMMLPARRFPSNKITSPMVRCCASLIPPGQGTPTGPVMGGTWEENGYETSENNGAPKIPSAWNKWFPHEKIPFSPKLGPYRVYLEKDQIYQVCACGESRTQPFCECVNGDFNRQRGFHPIMYVPRYSGWFLLNGSKHASHPIFNGTCWMVWCNVNIVPACFLFAGMSFVGSVFLSWMIHP